MNGEGRGDPVSRCGGAPSSTGWSFAAGSWIAVTLAVASLAMAPLAGCRTTTREDPPPGPAATGAADATSPPGAMAAGDAAGAGLAGRAGRAAGASAEDAASGRRIHVLGGSAEGRPIEAHVIGDGAQSVLILATIHGDEWAGTPLLEELAEVLEALASAGDLDARVVLVPIANPDGYAEGTRESSTGVDLNRNFPSSNYDARRGHGARPLSEPESRAVAAAVERFAPRAVVSIHQPLGCIDYDGPAGDLAAAMASVCDLPVRKLGARPGSLGSWVGLELGVPIITLELRRRDETLSAAELYRRYGEALLTAIRWRPDRA